MLKTFRENLPYFAESQLFPYFFDIFLPKVQKFLYY